MTVKELSQLYWLNREIEADERRLEELERRALTVSSPKLSDMQKGQSVECGIERLMAEIIDLRAIIAAKQQQCIYERSRLERYISNIPDSLTRQIFTLRFADGLSWVRVAHSIGGGNTAAGVKMVCYRYIKKNK